VKTRSAQPRFTSSSSPSGSRHPASRSAEYWTLGSIELRSILSARSCSEPARCIPACSRRKMRAKPSRASRPDTVHLRSLRQRPGTGPTRSRLRPTEFVRGLIRNSSRASLPADVPQKRANCIYGQCGSARCRNAAAFRKDRTTALEKMFDACAGDPACNAAFPNLREEFARYLLAYPQDPCASPYKDKPPPCRWIAVGLRSGFAPNFIGPEAPPHYPG
jgi:hypothetical protein